MPKLHIDARIQLGAWLIVALSAASYLIGKQISQETIQNFVKSYGILAPVIFVILHQISIVFAPVNGFPFLIAGFYLFGKNVAIYTYLTSIIGYSINFFIAKKWGRPIVEKLAGKESLAKIDKIEKEYGIGTLFFLRLFLIGLGDFISYGYGLTPIKYSTYIAITAVAMIPGHVLWYLIASKTGSIEQFLSVSVALTFAAGGIFVAGSYLVGKYRAKKS